MEIVAYQGEPGAYSEQGAIALFPEAEHRPQPSIRTVFESVEVGRAALGLVPMDNSQAGSINETYDLFLRHGLHLVGETVVRVDHSLLALPGSTIDTLEKVVSHPQAIAQCEEFLSALDVTVRAEYNTAGAAKQIAEKRLERTAAIASRRAGELYGLEVLAERIQTYPDNYTRFGALSRDPAPLAEPDKSSLVFGVGHVAGSLYRCLGSFAERHLNLTKLESQAARGSPVGVRLLRRRPGARPAARDGRRARRAEPARDLHATPRHLCRCRAVEGLRAVVTLAPPPTPALAAVRCPAEARSLDRRVTCGFVRVLLDRSNPASRTIKVYFERYPRRTAARRIATVLSIEGGPGFSTTADRAARVTLWRPLAARRPLLLVDLRGTGRSGALACRAFARSSRGYPDRAGRCAAQLGPRRDHYSTAASVEDLESVLRALGLGRVDLYGDSYGSYAAEAFAVRHPGRLRSLVLDSTYTLPGTDPAWADLIAAFRRGLRLACSRWPRCPVRGRDRSPRSPSLQLAYGPGRSSASRRTGTGTGFVSGSTSGRSPRWSAPATTTPDYGGSCWPRCSRRATGTRRRFSGSLRRRSRSTPGPPRPPPTRRRSTPLSPATTTPSSGTR